MRDSRLCGGPYEPHTSQAEAAPLSPPTTREASFSVLHHVISTGGSPSQSLALTYRKLLASLAHSYFISCTEESLRMATCRSFPQGRLGIWLLGPGAKDTAFSHTLGRPSRELSGHALRTSTPPQGEVHMAGPGLSHPTLTCWACEGPSGQSTLQAQVSDDPSPSTILVPATGTRPLKNQSF